MRQKGGFSKIFASALISIMVGGQDAKLGDKPPVTLHSHGSFHRKGKLKGWMRERKRCSFNKNK